MRRRAAQVVIFRFDERTEVLAAMAELGAGGGWINLQPGFDAEDAPRGSYGMLSGGVAPVPTCTWKPGEQTRRGIEYVALGVQHGTGGKAAPRLVERGVTVPDRWAVTQDSPRHGLIVAVPPVEPHHDVLAWLLEAGEVLSLIPITGEWRALVYRS